MIEQRGADERGGIGDQAREGDVLVATERSAGGAVDANSPHFKEPIIRQFKTELTLTMRDGQTVQTTQAADPLSGRVLTITVTMNVVK